MVETENTVNRMLNATGANESNFFWNRSDHKLILEQLSPIATFINTYGIQMKLHYLGLVGNLLCILVFTRKQMVHRKSIFYLIFLAMSDLLYNFAAALPDMLQQLRVVDYHIFKTSDLSCFFYDYIQVSFHVYSVLITLFVTVDRFNHIYNPLKFNQKFISKKTKIVVGFGLLIPSAILALPHGYLFVYNEKEKNCDGRQFLKTKIGNSSVSYYKAYFTFTEPIIMWFIPGLVIVCMNIYVIYKIFQSKKLPEKKLPSSTSFKNMFSNVSAGSQPGAPNGAALPMLPESRPPSSPPKLYFYKNAAQNPSARLYYEAIAAAHGIEFELIDQPTRSSPSSVSPPPSNSNFTNINANIYLNKFKFYFLCFIRAKSTDDANNRPVVAVQDYKLNEMLSRGRRDGIRVNETANLRKCSVDEFILNKHFNKRAVFSSKTGANKDLARHTSLQSSMNILQSNRMNTLKYRIINLKNTKLSVNQISHYITIIILGFYFIVTTIPYGILLSLQNNFTIDLNYNLKEASDYLNNPVWIEYGQIKDASAFVKNLFITNHCFNFFLYVLFNRLFRLTIMQIMFNLKKFFHINLSIK